MSASAAPMTFARHPHGRGRHSAWLTVTAALLTLVPAWLHADSTTVINEIHYHPADDSQTEWIELANTLSTDMDLGGWRLTGAVEFTFPLNTTIKAGRFLVIAADPTKVRLRSLFESPLGPFQGRLSNGGERIELRNVSNRLMSWVDYEDRSPWPPAADGSGATLSKIDPETDSASVESWRASASFGGTPGGPNDLAEPTRNFVLNEIDPSGWIEIANHGDASSLDGHVLAIAGDPQRQATLPAIAIAPGERFVVDQNLLSFELHEGDLLGLYTPNQTGVLDAQRVGATLRGRSPRYSHRWLRPEAPTPGEPNRFAFEEAIVINEIMYRPYPLPAAPAQPPAFDQVTLSGPEAHWQFWQDVPQRDGAWREIGFDGTDWETGGAPFSGGASTLPPSSPTPTELRIGKSTYYFRLTFQVDALKEGQTLQLRHLVDDGAVIYLNGQEVARFNLPEGELTASTRPLAPVEDPQWSDVLVLPAERLTVGTNVLAAEVRQSSAFDRDIAFDAEVSLGKQIAPGLPAQPFRDGPEEWIELTNRSDRTVDLSGWSLDEAVRFEFPAGTLLQPQGFLVVTNDRPWMAEKYPHLDALLGNFQGQLSNSGENLLLRDRQGNPADEVRYYDGGRWPATADGGGSSLELRDPGADNATGEAWAASDESGKTQWQDIRYRMVAGQRYGLNTWNELRIGMLTAGEVLLDDIEVIADPDGAARPLIQNGTFRDSLFSPGVFTNRWRFLGNHRHSQAVPDPEDPHNHVLHLKASGATDTKHNHLETTFQGNDRLKDGEEYEVRMRARWVAGSNQVNVRAYYGRLAQTLLLDVPTQHGTPGRPNSTRTENIGPTYQDFGHQPLLPAPSDPVEVSVQASDPDGIAQLTLFYAVDGESFQSLPMPAKNDGLYAATLPPLPAATVVQFYVTGKDTLGNTSHFPRKGPASRALYIVDDGRGTDLPIHEIRLIMTAADFDFLFDELNLISNERIGCSLLLDNDRMVYDTGVRLKGSPAGRARDGALYQGFNLAFPPEHLYRGIHSSVSIDRSGRAPRPGGQDEIFVKHMFNRAGIPYMFDDLGHLVSPTRTHTGTAIFSMARYGRVFTNTQFENGETGSVFNLEITYDPTTTVGNRESLKKPVPFSHGGATDFRDLGEDKEQYRWAFEMRTGRRADDYEGLIRFCQTLDLPGDQLARQVEEVMNVDQWMRTAAMHNLCGIGDTWWNNGLQHNLRLYVPSNGDGAVGLPWDLDFVFTSGASAPIKSTGGNLRRVMDLPIYTRLYYGHLLDLIDQVFNPDYMEPWLEHYGSRVNQNFRTNLGYIRSRAQFVRDRVEREAPPVDFAITSNDGQTITTDTRSILLQGTGWVNVRAFQREGEQEPISPVWTSSEAWEVRLPLNSGANPIELHALDFQGSRLASDHITVISTATDPHPYEHLRITELHFHPSSGDALEFVEFFNLSEQPLDLTGVHFSNGLSFAFADGTMLPGRTHGLIVQDRHTFLQEHGESPEVFLLGEYGPSNLSNGGESLTLQVGAQVILSFAYDDEWIPESDGQGASLVIKDPEGARPLWGEATAWRASAAPGGSPGTQDAPTPEDVSPAWTQLQLNDQALMASYRRAVNSSQSFESSTDLQVWSAISLETVAVDPLSDEVEVVTLTIPRNLAPFYVRLRPQTP